VSDDGFSDRIVDSRDLLFVAVGHLAKAGRPDLNVGSVRD
jgi:hypothetical protein